MKSKHDVRAQQSRRRFLADTALGAAGLGLEAAGMESAQAQTKWEKMIKGLQTVTTDVLIVGSGAAGAPGGPVPGFCGGPKKRFPGPAGVIPGRGTDFRRLRGQKLGLPFLRLAGTVPERGPDF